MKAIFSALVAVLACAAASNSFAANEISKNTLAQMGFSGLSVMSDSDGLAVRGKGFQGCSSCGTRTPSLSTAYGNSFATINLEGCDGCIPSGDAHSENGYLSFGQYAASGTNFSEAGAVVTKTETVSIGGVVNSVTNTTATRVFAGGFSSATSF
jgi:hypothetical protein